MCIVTWYTTTTTNPLEGAVMSYTIYERKVATYYDGHYFVAPQEQES